MKPNNKVSKGGFASALAVLVVWGLGQAGLTVPPEAAAALSAVVYFLVSYFVKEKDAS